MLLNQEIKYVNYEKSKWYANPIVRCEHATSHKKAIENTIKIINSLMLNTNMSNEMLPNVYAIPLWNQNVNEKLQTIELYDENL